MIWRLSFWGRRTSIKQGVMPEIVVSGMIFLMLGVSAVDAKESPTALQKLNSIFADEYSMKVFKTKSGSYVARTLDGKDVLVAK